MATFRERVFYSLIAWKNWGQFSKSVSAGDRIFPHLPRLVVCLFTKIELYFFGTEAFCVDIGSRFCASVIWVPFCIFGTCDLWFENESENQVGSFLITFCSHDIRLKNPSSLFHCSFLLYHHVSLCSIQ